MLALALLLPALAPQGDVRPPNVVVVLADDLGYGDVTINSADSLIPTPRLEELAAGGLRFTDAHSPDAVCTPTRYGILTGRYAWRTWLKRNVVGGYTPPLIETDRPTLPKTLAAAGYRTGCFGKWHLGLGWTRANGFVGTAANAQANFRGTWQDGKPEDGMNVDFTVPIQGGPTALGFDAAFFTAACPTIDGPFTYIRDDRVSVVPDHMIRVNRDAGPDLFPRPGWIAPGFVLEDVDPTFTREAIAFMERSVADDPEKPFFVYLALSAPHAPWLPPTFAQGRSEEGPRGDLVWLADWCLGQVMDALDRMGVADETLVVFTSDNGPRHGAGEHRSAGELRGYKSHIWEGGHRVPFVARWPGHVPAGTASSEPIELTDLYATCATLAGAVLPEGAAPDSYDVSSALLGARAADAEPIREAVVSHSMHGVFAIRQGRYKLIEGTKTSGGWVEPSGRPAEPGAPGQLYDLTSDLGEQRDLFEERPEVVAELQALLDRYREQGFSVVRKR
jgi:arylsulfatase A